jgi:hypothetical protein
MAKKAPQAVTVTHGTVLLTWSKTFEKYTITPASGNTPATKTPAGPETRTGNVFLRLEANFITHFNITTYIAAGATAGATADTTDTYNIINVAGGTRNVYTTIDGTATTAITYDAFDRLTGGKKQSNRQSGHTIQLPVNKLTAKGLMRHVSLRFPRFFNLIMIAQATSQMMQNATAANQPLYFKTQSGVTYPLYYSTGVLAKAVISPSKSGAWVNTAPVTPSNNDGSEGVSGNVTTTDNSGK